MRWATRRGCHTLAGSAGALIAVAGSSPRWLLAYPLAAGAGLLASARLTTGVDYHAESGAQACTWPSRTLGSTPRPRRRHFKSARLAGRWRHGPRLTGQMPLPG
jgi:hypothetical protein